MRALYLLLLAGCGRFGFGDATAMDAAPADARADAPGDAPAFIAPGVAVRYAMDNDPVDGTIASAELPATCTSCPTATAGVHGGAYRFDGTVRFELPSNTLIGLTPYSVAVWFRLDAAPDPGYGRAMVAKYYDDAHTTDVLSLVIRTGNIPNYETTSSIATTSYLPGPAVDVGVWHHIAATWDGTSKRLYLDGGLVGAIVEPVLDSLAPISIGADTDQGTTIHPWNGALDELQFYGRALTAGEVAQIAAP